MLLGSATNHLCMYEQKNKANRSARPALTLTFTQIHENYMDTFFCKEKHAMSPSPEVYVPRLQPVI